MGLQRSIDTVQPSLHRILHTKAKGESISAKRWSAVATVAKTKELKKRYGTEEGEESSHQFLERAVSRERLFLSARGQVDNESPSNKMARFEARCRESPWIEKWWRFRSQHLINSALNPCHPIARTAITHPPEHTHPPPPQIDRAKGVQQKHKTHTCSDSSAASRPPSSCAVLLSVSPVDPAAA